MRPLGLRLLHAALPLALGCTATNTQQSPSDPSEPNDLDDEPGSGDSGDSSDPGDSGDPADSGDSGDDSTAPPPKVRINELMPANRGSVSTPGDSPLDWVELVNLDTEAVDLTGWALTDDWREPQAAPLPDGIVLAPGEYLLLWLDPEASVDGAVQLGLAREGEAIRLFDPRGEEADLLGYPELRVDEAWARIPDGVGEAEAMPRGTPGVGNGRVAEQTVRLVLEGDSWRYLDGGAIPDGGMAGSWTTADFDDSTWSEGEAPLGYGDTQVTVIDDGATEAGKAITAFFRSTFELDGDADALLSAKLGLRADDGARVWLDGEELARVGLPSGEVGPDTTASRTVSGDGEITYQEEEIDIARLSSGTHQLAVDLHQANSRSSDMTFDMWLEVEMLSVVE